jgi:hypothetical protein
MLGKNEMSGSVQPWSLTASVKKTSLLFNSLKTTDDMTWWHACALVYSHQYCVFTNPIELNCNHQQIFNMCYITFQSSCILTINIIKAESFITTDIILSALCCVQILKNKPHGPLVNVTCAVSSRNIIKSMPPGRQSLNPMTSIMEYYLQQTSHRVTGL